MNAISLGSSFALSSSIMTTLKYHLMQVMYLAFHAVCNESGSVKCRIIYRVFSKWYFVHYNFLRAFPTNWLKECSHGGRVAKCNSLLSLMNTLMSFRYRGRQFKQEGAQVPYSLVLPVILLRAWQSTVYRLTLQMLIPLFIVLRMTFRVKTCSKRRSS